MGVVAKVASALKKAFANDKLQVPYKLAKGNTIFSNRGSIFQGDNCDLVEDRLTIEHSLIARFRDYLAMDTYPEISSALDIFADDATQYDTERNHSVWVTSKDKHLQDNLNLFLWKQLRIEEDIWEITREVCWLGNDYEELIVSDEGVIGLNFLPAPTVRRIEGDKGQLLGFVQDRRCRFNYSKDSWAKLMSKRGEGDLEKLPSDVAVFEDWEVVHFRLRGKYRRSIYGVSILESARWIYKRLMLLEDAAMLYRLQRAPERFAFYVDVGDMPPAEAIAYVNRVRQQLAKKKYRNDRTGKLDVRYDPPTADENFYIPSRKGQDATRIETIGAPAWQVMDDIEYFRDKLWAAIKIPKAHLAQEEGVVRSILSAQDVRFARTILRVQRVLRNGLDHIIRVHLIAVGQNPDDLSWELYMTVPSSIFELAQLEVKNARADLAARMGEHVSIQYLLEHVYHLTDEESKLIIQQRYEDVVRNLEAEGKGQAAAAKLQPATAVADISPDISKQLSELGARTRRRAGLHGYSPSFSPKDLMEHDRITVARLDKKFSEIASRDSAFMQRLGELRGLLRDIHVATGRKH